MFATKLISTLYTRVLKPIFFMQDPEDVHDRMLKVGSFLGRFSVTRAVTSSLFNYNSPLLEQEICGVKFKLPVGLSAGFDKDGHLTTILPAVGFGHMEVGSVTAKPYEGNRKPRLYRLPKSKSLVVYYGLKNEGVGQVLNRVRLAREKVNEDGFKVGVSIAKTNSEDTVEREAGIRDYVEGFKRAIESGVGDYFTINISCPNTFGGEPFSKPELLEPLLKGLVAVRDSRPLFLKMPINLKWEQFDQLLGLGVKYGVNGVVIGNLNKDRSSNTILDPIPEHVNGSLSGVPTRALSNRLISQTYKKYGDKLIIVGVGGIFSAQDAYEKIKLGASLLQLITGMIFEGPQLIGSIHKGLEGMLKEDGYGSISEAVGAAHRS